VREWKQCIWCSSVVLSRSRIAELGRNLHHDPRKSAVAVVAIIQDTSIGGLEACLHSLLSQSLGMCKSEPLPHWSNRIPLASRLLINILLIANTTGREDFSPLRQDLSSFVLLTLPTFLQPTDQNPLSAPLTVLECSRLRCNALQTRMKRLKCPSRWFQ
jgi:hypothetical protein